MLTRAREPGAILNAGETVFALTLTAPVWVCTYVAETDLGVVQPGMAVRVTTDGGRTDEAEYCDRVALIYRGWMIAAGSPDDLKDQARADEDAEPTLEAAGLFALLVRSTRTRLDG